MSNLENTTGGRLKLMRLERRLKQSEIAEIIGISEQSLSRYENDGRIPRGEDLKKLANLFDCSTDYILGLSPIRTPYDEIAEKLLGRRDLLRFWDEIRNREDAELLLDNIASLSPETIQRVVEIIKLFDEEKKKRPE